MGIGTTLGERSDELKGSFAEPPVVSVRTVTVTAAGASDECFAEVGQVRLCYQRFGDPADPTVLLIMGLGLSMLWWRGEFCTALAGRGLHVVRFDNRDVGRSTICSGRGISPLEHLTRRAHPVYSLGDMADDAAGLIAVLDRRGAHVVGVSLGAFIAQELTIRHPGLTRSLVSIMGRPGDRRSGRRSPRLMVPDLRRPKASAEPEVESMVRTFRRIGSPGRTVEDDEDVRRTTRRSAARAEGDGAGRQLAAAIAERDRTADLGRVQVPTLVVHGALDRVIKPSGGRATAAAVPGAQLWEVPEMGHDLPRRLWPRLIERIVQTIESADGPLRV